MSVLIKKDLTAGAARAEPGSVVCSTLTPASRNLRFEILEYIQLFSQNYNYMIASEE